MKTLDLAFRFVALLFVLRIPLFGAEEIVQLPPLLVEDTAALEKWTYYRSEHFEVISCADSRATTRVISGLEKAMPIMLAWLPADMIVTPTMPASIILDDRGSELLRGYIPGTNLRRNEAFLEADEGDHSVVYLDVYFRERYFKDTEEIINRHYNELIDVSRSQALHSVLRSLLRHGASPPPEWFVQGLNIVRPEEARLTLSTVRPRWDVRVLQGRGFRQTRPKQFHPLEKTLAGLGADNQDPEHREWEFATGGFMRWALSYDHGKYQQAFWRYVEHQRRNPFDGERAFQAYFGKSISEVQTMMTEFDANSEFVITPLKSSTPTTVEKFSKGRPATNTEIIRIHAGWARAASREYPDLEKMLLGSAKRLLDVAKDTSDPDLQAERGLFFAQIGQADAARESLQKAVAGGTRRSLAAIRLSQLLLESAVRDPAKEGKLDQADTAAILKPLELAYRHQPKLREMYATAAHVWLRSSADATESNLAFLREAIQLFPRDSQLALQIAHVHEKYGQKEHAVKIAEHGLAFALPQDQPRFRALLEALRTH